MMLMSLKTFLFSLLVLPMLSISAPQLLELDEDSPLGFSNDHRLLVEDIDGNLAL